MSTAMRLDDLLAGHADCAGFADVIVRGLSLDSRAVVEGDAFVALQGSREHGLGFAASALARGARIVLAETAPAAAQFAVAGDVLWIDGLREKRLATLFTGAESRVAKYKHTLTDVLLLTPGEVALLCVLMLRGPQTLGELRTRSERLFTFDTMAEVEEALNVLAARQPQPLVAKLPRHWI